MQEVHVKVPKPATLSQLESDSFDVEDIQVDEVLYEEPVPEAQEGGVRAYKPAIVSQRDTDSSAFEIKGEGHVLTRCWLEVRKLWLVFIIFSILMSPKSAVLLVIIDRFSVANHRASVHLSKKIINVDLLAGGTIIIINHI